MDSELTVAARRVLEANWHPAGYTSPNPTTYPWQWLWDSCFHALVWVALGEPGRARIEIESALAPQTPPGFVPHMRYVGDERHHEEFWGRPGTSSITQPPMYGHAVAELARAGHDTGDLVARASRGVEFLLARPRTPNGLVPVVHPWESGCDDSPRWDDDCPGGMEAARWFAEKGRLVETIEFDASGGAVANPEFAVGSAGFNALIVFNGRELLDIGGPSVLAEPLDALSDALDGQWSSERSTWVDDRAGGTGGRARTLDALLPALLGGRGTAVALASLVDPAAHGGRYGPTGVHRAEPVFDPRGYWRGSTWPQLTYLLWLASTRSMTAGSSVVAAGLARSLQDGALRSGFAEHWDPDSGDGLGAAPQSWSALAALV